MNTLHFARNQNKSFKNILKSIGPEADPLQMPLKRFYPVTETFFSLSSIDKVI